MVSTSEGVVYYCTVFFTALVFLTEASAITTNYEKSTTFNKANGSQEISPQRTKLALARGSRGSLSKNQNHERASPITLTRLNSNTKIETVPQNESKRELLLAANSGSNNDVKDKGGGGGTGGNVDDDDQKTLSQQVADGKYGLIQDEIFTAKPTRPGVISYDVNPEVPKDNVNNLGGLELDDIWLAENHLLVLAGGALNGMQLQWRPIDNYVAPSRPVQIPPNPKVAPPFPVQLSENGPVEYIRSNYRPAASFTPFYNSFQTQYQNANKSLYGKLQHGQPGGVTPLRPQLKPQFPANPNSPLSAPVYVKPPPGAEFIPPYLGNVNQSEAADEDDPSLYYPPPYDFYYPKDNSSKVPPGPLVPGIVLPPPPNFFIRVTNNTNLKETSTLTAVTEKPPYKQHYNQHKTAKQLQYAPVGAENENVQPTTGKPAQPSTLVSFNDIINQVTYPDSGSDKIKYADVKANKVGTEEVAEGWIPIPAPKPYYITGVQKPLKSTVLVMMDAPESHGYTYDKPQNSFKITPKKATFKYLHYSDKPRDQYYSTTPVSPQPVSTKLPLGDSFTTTPVSSYHSPPTIKATYYFYEEPQFVDYGPSTSTHSTSSPLPATSAADPNDFILAKSMLQDTNSKGNGSREKKRKPITPMIPIYYLAELENLVDLVKPMNLPYPPPVTPTPKEEYYTTTAKPSYTINKPNYERPTPKPIFEYNYIASDYNGPANQGPHSTRQPTSYEVSAQYPLDYNAYYHLSQYPHNIFGPIAQFNKPDDQTTASPVLFLQNVNHYVPQNVHPAYDSFDRPWMPNLNPYGPLSYPTENPYYAFFTKEEEDLIDENTKKYFTIFGQKIKQSVEATSPYSVRTPAPTTTISWKTKYGYAGGLPSQQSTSGGGGGGGAGYGGSHGSTTPYSVAYSAHHTHRMKPNNNNEESINASSKPLSLEGDTLVNYVTPSPTMDPDAEYVTPKISKHIRPIVVEDLPADLNERLKNVMNLQRNRKKSSNDVNNKSRYVLIDNGYDSRQYQQNFINTYGGKYTTEGRNAESYTYTRRKKTSTPLSLENDYQSSTLAKDPDVEYVQNSSEYREHRSNVDADEYDGRTKGQESRNTKPVSLHNDILVNYKQNGRYNTNPDAELIDSSSSEKTNPPSRGSSSNTVISYKYPGVEYGHFYFLTPQETHLTQIENERYDFQSDVEKPSGYFKRVPTKQQHQNPSSTPTKS